MHWVSWATKTFSYVGQIFFKRWLFDAEFLGASRSVYTSDRGGSPYVSIGVSIRVHNRNSALTTVFVRSIGAKLESGVERGLDRAVMFQPGPIGSMNDLAGYNSYEVPGSSSMELTLSTRKYNPPNLEEYLESSSPQIMLELGETFGNSRRLIGPMKFGGLNP